MTQRRQPLAAVALSQPGLSVSALAVTEIALARARHLYRRQSIRCRELRGTTAYARAWELLAVIGHRVAILDLQRSLLLEYPRHHRPEYRRHDLQNPGSARGD